MLIANYRGRQLDGARFSGERILASRRIMFGVAGETEQVEMEIKEVDPHEFF
ncbi:hypothetical protein HanIR_Chr01g0043761 [Helianthus annuus]|nr:hypothetical protein HanIR_Chr01g0043761 [Helianthus annuus]